ncbi:MAG: glycosyltransferase family 39 protein [Anaerolineales bacterium]|nr:glycosyltransferase family 39 protein [Anaerolineales bacterium]
MRPRISQSNWPLFVLLALSLAIHVVGIRKDLPYLTHVDEYFFVTPAVSMAATGSLDPGWFGHPGSTVIYPLALVFRIQRWLAQAGVLDWGDLDLLAMFAANSTPFYLTGRVLTILYALMSLPLIYLLGLKAFSRRVGLIGAWLTLFYTLVIHLSQVVRTDSAATFFCLLSLWRILEVYERPTKVNHLWAGACIGLAVSSRYFMATLILLLLVVDGLLLLRSKNSRKALLLAASVGLAAAMASFVLSTPYFVLNFGTASINLAAEADNTAVGADGLSQVGNLAWYLGVALPSAMYWHQYILAIAGVLVAAARKRVAPAILVGFVMIFLASISLSALHKQHWLVQTLPVLALFAASGLVELVDWLSGRFRLGLQYQRLVLLLCVLAISLWPAYKLAIFIVRQANYSTRVLAGEWMVANLPPESRVYQEWYCPPTQDTGYFVRQRFSLARDPLSYYYERKYDYLVVSNAIYLRYLAEPERYPEEVKFYRTLFEKGRLVHVFQPSRTRGGPTIQIYKLPKREANP